MKAIAIVSGGMDSVTLAYLLPSLGYTNLHLLSFDYGQRHKKEIQFAKLAAERLLARHSVMDLSSIGQLLKSSLTDLSIPVPDGHYAAENMKSTVVPNRNAIMLSIAYGIAVAEQADAVAIGVHAGDHFIYPDCRPGFINAFRTMQEHAIRDMGNVSLLAPFIDKSKADIVGIGSLLNVPYKDTWSCYRGGDVHCAVCGTCEERRFAFLNAKVKDPTQYDIKGLLRVSDETIAKNG